MPPANYPTDERFSDIDEFKQLLLERKDQVARNLMQNLLVYATGAGLQFADRATWKRSSPPAVERWRFAHDRARNRPKRSFPNQVTVEQA